ncbi:MAG: protein kinase [bacterium]|nr:protein kinase [bacterium]
MVEEPADDHPDTLELQRWLTGDDLDETTIADIDAHLTHCSNCLARLQSLQVDAMELTVRAVVGKSSQTATRLSEGYEIGEVVGRGASGVVHRGVHRGLGRTVAIKMLVGGSQASPDALARFQRESQALAMLNHPNVVRIYDVGEQDGTPYLAMEWIEGPSLRQYLRDVRLQEQDAARLVAALAGGVSDAHEHGILHRDLKPDNVLLTVSEDAKAKAETLSPRRVQSNANEIDFSRNETFKVVDFGLARLTRDDRFQTRTGDTLGTPSYMAPEQIRCQPEHVTVRTDVYGLGAILYECLTGRPPLQGNTAADTIRLVLEQDPVPVQSLRPGVSRDLAVICHRCLSKSPTSRFDSAEALREDLLRYLSGKPILSRPVSVLERGLKWARKNPWPVVAASTLTLAAFATLSIQAIYQQWLKSERDVALKNYQNARAAIWQILDAAEGESDFDIPRLQQLRMNQLAKASDLFERLAEQEQTPMAHRDLAQIRVRYGSGLIAEGKTEQGERLLKLSRQTFAELSAGSPDDADLAARLVEAEVKQAYALSVADRRDEASKLIAATLPIAEDLHRRFPNDLRRTNLLAWTWHNLGSVIDCEHDRQAAINAFCAAVDLRIQASHRAPDNDELLRFLAESQISLGSVRMAVDGAAAAKDFSGAIDTLLAILDSNPKDMQSTISLAVAYLNRSNILVAEAATKEAIQECSEGIRLLQRALAANPDQSNASYYLAMLYGNRAFFASQTENKTAAIEDWKSALAATDDIAIHEFCQLQLARDLMATSQLDEAAEAARQLSGKSVGVDTRTELLALQGTILNAYSALDSDSANSVSQAERRGLVSSIRHSLQRLAGNGEWIDDSATRELLLESPELATFRNEVGTDYLEALFRK